MEDLVLWQNFKNGDRDTFEILIRRYYRPLFLYGRKLLLDEDNLKDCIHDLFTHLWERRNNLNDVDHIRPYLFKSLRNQILKEKQRSVLLTNIDDFLNEDFVMEDGIESQIIYTDAARENRERILQIMHGLTRRQREIIHLKFYENLSNNEISTVMEISAPAVSNLLHQTLRLFREKWHALLYNAFLIYLMF